VEANLRLPGEEALQRRSGGRPPVEPAGPAAWQLRHGRWRGARTARSSGPWGAPGSSCGATARPGLRRRAARGPAAARRPARRSGVADGEGWPPPRRESAGAMEGARRRRGTSQAGRGGGAARQQCGGGGAAAKRVDVAGRHGVCACVWVV